jgi:hypothetical protein
MQKYDRDPDVAPHMGASVINMLFMVLSTHFKYASNKYEIMLMKPQKIDLWALILMCFWALGPVWGRTEGHLGGGIQKNMKKSLLETLLFDTICEKCWDFSGLVFHMFS